MNTLVNLGDAIEVTITSTSQTLQELVTTAGFSGNLPTGLDACNVTNPSQPFRYRRDGGTASSTKGILVKATADIATLYQEGTAVSDYQFARAGSSDSVVMIELGFANCG